jgi:protein-disulfide isomerase
MLSIGLVVGVALGFAIRPLVLPSAPAQEGPTPVGVVEPTPTEAIAPTPTDTTRSSTGGGVQPTLMDVVIERTRHFKGDPNAPVTIVEFGDFQCPFCGRFAAEAGRQIDEEYVQTGLVRFGYQHFAFLGPESQWAAEASECAAEQDGFWAYHDLLFERQAGENQGAFSKENLKAFAADLELDTAAFNECLDSGRYTSLIAEDRTWVRSLGVQSTPSFLINGQPLVGAQPFEVFQQAIEAALDETGE